MFRNVVSVASCLSILLTSSIPAAAMSDGKSGTIYYRYKDFMPSGPNNPGGVSKDVMAFYIGGVDIPFSEILPLKPEWEDDSWRVVGGILPDGVTFNAQTRTFEGTPTKAVSGLTVDLEGFDTENRSVATARATFDIQVVKGVPVKTDIYAHTGKYRVTELAVPAGITIDTWQVVTSYPAPPGVTFAGRYMEGYPANAGTWNYMVLGRNYQGEVVATFYGNYIVEDRPMFPAIADMVYDLPYPYAANPLTFDFGPKKILRSVGAASKVRYYLELDTTSSLPGNVTSNYDSSALRLEGIVTQPYDTAKIRWKAVDTDETEGWSNWFTFGSRDPNPICINNGPPPKLFFATDKTYATKIGAVAGGKGTISYAYKSGTLPSGLTFDAPTGRIVGRPAKATAASIFRIDVNVTNGSNVVTETCAYEVSSVNGNFSLKDATAEQARHVRVGKPYNGTLAVSGGLANFETRFTDPSAWPEYSFSTATQNTAAVGITGVPSAVGTFSIPFTSTNGDGNTVQRSATVYAHPELSVAPMADVHVKRLASSQVWATIPVDKASVIPDTTKGGQPKFSLAPLSDMPSDVVLSNDGNFTGLTKAAVGPYGPFTVAVSDFTGDTKTTNPFKVIVEPRDEIGVEKLLAPVFTVEWDIPKSTTPVTPKQPEGAAKFRVNYTLNNNSGKPDPSWLQFDTTNGKMTAAAGIPFDQIGKIGPFSVTMTDEEGSTVTSDPFDITLADWPEPAATIPGNYRGTVSGNTSAGETATFVTIPSVLSAIDADTVIGGLAAVAFVEAEPSKPAGLDFNISDGSFSGVPSSEFNGPVTITFKDGKGREGTVTVPLEVKAYPKVATSKTSYDLSRLANASNAKIAGQTVFGFWNQPTWTVDTVKGTDISVFGLSVNPQTGAIQGATAAPVDTLISNIVLKASSKGANNETLESWTPAFSIKVVAPSSMKLTYAPDAVTYFMSRNQAGGYDLVSRTPAVPSVTGSFVAPLNYAADLSSAVAAGLPSTMTFDNTSGQFVGVPDDLGTWSVPVTVSDNEGRSPDGAPTTLNVKSTLAGNVVASNGGGSLTLRQEEPFQTDALSISNEVRPVVFSATPAAMPATVSGGFDPQTGAFSDQSYFPAPASSYKVSVSVKDAHGRNFKDTIDTNFRIVAPLAMSVSSASLSIQSKQYSVADTIDVAFAPTVTNAIGVIRYSIAGTLPGTAVSRVYDDQGLMTGYVWGDDVHSYEIGLDPTGTVTEYKVDGSPRQIALVTLPDGTVGPAPTAFYFPPDALVFDTMLATLKGIPSRSGEFPFKIVASDNHAKDYIREVATRKTYNEAQSRTVTISVAPAEPLLVSNSAVSETLAQYTTQPSLRSTTTNAAYGLAVSWTQVSGTLPDGVSPIKGGSAVSYTGYPTKQGTFPSIAWKATDAAGRTAESEGVTMVVGNRKDFMLSADTPVVMAVNALSSPTVVSTLNAAFGKVVKAADWTVSGVSNLPPGIVHTVSDGGVEFSGTPTVIGKYEGITVSAHDSLGAAASISLVFEVVNPSGPITLATTDIVTRPGIPFSAQATSGNTYGKVQYYSYDIDGDPKTKVPGQYVADLDIGIGTGLVTGVFPTVGDRSFDVYVTDATNRVTSRPVSVSVIPDLRSTVPILVQATQGSALTRTTDIAYNIGTVTYEKGTGNWPDGITVDPQTGSILGYDNSTGTVANRVLTAPGSYADLTIVATDTFTVSGVPYTQSRPSNAFTLEVAPSTAIPDIANPAKTILGTEGTPIADWTPSVVEKGTTKKWVLGGTVYSSNYDLGQYGLKFDTKTGVISGTPNAPFIIRDFKITVTSARGDADATTAFWLGVAPKDPIALSSLSETVIKVRRNDPFLPKPLIWDNTIGDLTHLKTSGHAVFGVETATGKITSTTTSATWGIADWPIGIKVTDEFNRTATTTVTLSVSSELSVSMANFMAAVDVQTSSGSPTVAGNLGTLTYTASGLPSNWSVDPNSGIVSGVLDPDDTDEGKVKKFPFTLTVTDAQDGKTASAGVNIYLDGAGYKYFRIYEPKAYTYWGCMYVDLLNPAGTRVNTLVTTSPYAGRTKVNSASLVSKVSDNCQIASAGGVHFMQWNFTQPQLITSVKTWFDNSWNQTNSQLRAPQFQVSDDGTNWTTLFTGATNNKSGGLIYEIPQ